MDERESDTGPATKASWFKFFPSDFLADVGGLKAGERGIYITLLAIMHDFGEPIACDAPRLARRCGTTQKAFEDTLKALMEGVLIVEKSGELWSPLIDREIENFTRKSKSAQKNARIGWGKRQQNQHSKNADAYRSQRSDVRGRDSDDLKDHQNSSTSQSPQPSLEGDSEEAAREGATSDQVSINDEVDLGSFGWGWVEKIISWNPLVTVVRTDDKIEGGTRVFRVEHSLEGKLRKRPMTEIEFDALPVKPDTEDSNNDAA